MEGMTVKLTVVGLGYIGLPTSIMFAKHGVDVLFLTNSSPTRFSSITRYHFFPAVLLNEDAYY